MADFSTIIQEINEDITTNGVGAITGAKLNEVLRDMIAAVNQAKADMEADGSIFGGWIISQDTPPTYDGDKRYFYYAQQAGTYVYFDNVVLDGAHLAMLYWDENLNQWNYINITLSGNGLANVLSNYIQEESLFIKLGFQSFETFYNYDEGEVVSYEGNLYQFTANHPAGPWTGDDVDIVTMNGMIVNAISLLSLDKADKVSGATQGNLAGLDANGNLTDSGKSPSDFATAAQGGKADTAVQPSDLATVATSGSYNDLLNKPTIPAAQVNSDWNANSGVAQILNKPTIPAAQVQSDWDEADNTKVDYIKNKPTIPNVSGKADKVVGAVSGDVATLDGNGNLTDSGLSVFDFFVMVEDASTPPASMAPNNVYQYGTLSGNTTFPPLATPTEPDIANVYCWTFTTPASAPTITWPSGITSWAGGSAPTINASKSYEVSVMDGFATIIEN